MYVEFNNLTKEDFTLIFLSMSIPSACEHLSQHLSVAIPFADLDRGAHDLQLIITEKFLQMGEAGNVTFVVPAI